MNAILNSGLEYFENLFKESDRGCVLLLTSDLDERLGELHKAHIETVVDDPDKLIESLFRPFAPLATFGGRIQLGLGYGLIGMALFLDLELLRKTRNLVAHNTSGFVLADQKTEVQKLRSHRLTMEDPEFADFYEHVPKEQLEKAKQGHIDNPKVALILAGITIGFLLLRKTLHLKRMRVDLLKSDFKTKLI